MIPTKKISFGFNKLTKKPNIFTTKPVENKNIELIDCLEGQAIKLKDAVKEVKGPLIIPLKDDEKTLLDRIKHSKKASGDLVVKEDNRPDSELTLDELAARQLLQEAKTVETVKTITKVLTLPSIQDKVVFEGQEESTLDDYENVPISDYGFAILRGMGWSEGSAIGKNNKNVIKTIEPELRPKGMGLGANKMLTVEKKPVDKDGNELSLVKGAFVKVIAGKHKGSYCEVIGLDDEAGRVIVKTALKSLTLSLNEFLIVPVSKEEYAKFSKVINNEIYKEITGIKSECHNDLENKLIKEEKIIKHERERGRSSSYEMNHHTGSKVEKTTSKHSSMNFNNTVSNKNQSHKDQDTHNSNRDKYDSDSNSNERSSHRKSRSKSKEQKHYNDSNSVDHRRVSNKSKHKSHDRNRDKKDKYLQTSDSSEYNSSKYDRKKLEKGNDENFEKHKNSSVKKHKRHRNDSIDKKHKTKKKKKRQDSTNSDGEKYEYKKKKSGKHSKNHRK